VAGTHLHKNHTQILSDPSWRVSWTCGSCYPWVFPRVYSWVPVEDPDLCSALDMGGNLCGQLRWASMVVRFEVDAMTFVGGIGIDFCGHWLWWSTGTRRRWCGQALTWVSMWQLWAALALMWVGVIVELAWLNVSNWPGDQRRRWRLGPPTSLVVEKGRGV